MPVERTKNYTRRRVMAPSRCAKGSFRTKRLSKRTSIVVCCPKGEWSKRRKRCEVGMKRQSVLKRRKRRK